MTNQTIPVITVDGPSGTGKGTASMIIANRLGWHYLDSGSLYRLLALAAKQQELSYDDDSSLTELATSLDVEFNMDSDKNKKSVLLMGKDITDAIRTEEISRISSIISSSSGVRAALVTRQKAFLQPPGLVTDGRDMGTVIFPDAPLKLFMTASAEIRAQRRLNQLKNKGFDGNLDAILSDLNARDRRDRERTVSPLIAADDAVLIDTSDLSIDDVISKIWTLIVERKLL